MTRPVNTILAISIIVLIAAVISGIIWWQFSQQAEDISPANEQAQQQNIQQNVQEQGELAGWKTYRNEDLNYSIKYPSSWKILGPLEGSSGHDVLLGPNPEPPGMMEFPTNKTYIMIAIVPLYGKSPEEGIAGFRKTRTDYASETQVTIAEQNAYKFSNSKLDKYDAIRIPYKGQLYQIFFIPSIKEVQESLSTFKFTK